MLTVLLRSQPDVRDRLFQLVEQSARPVLVAQEHDLAFGGAFERRQPYRYLLEHGAPVSIVLVADDGHEGLWRDPVGDLCERYFDARGDIAAAAGGYLLFREGLEPTYLKRDLWEPLHDVRALIARLRLSIPPPEQPKAEPERPRYRRATDDLPQDEIETDPGVSSRARPPIDENEPRRRPRPGPGARPATPPPSPAPEPDAFALLGVPPTADEETVKKAFRALVVQYHPDKVAHLAPEFRALAEEKTRALTAAYETAQRILRGEKPDHG